MTLGESFLPMWPDPASAGYVAARMRLVEAEKALIEHVERVAAARRALPPGALVADYTLTEVLVGPDADGAAPQRRLSELFGEHRTLLIYHLMFHPDAEQACPMCSMWVDGFDAVTGHLAQHTGFAVVAKAAPGKLREWARRRGWANVRLLSSNGTSFNADLRAETPTGDQRPMITVFVRDGDAVRHSYSQPASFPDGSERGIDLLSPVWNLLDLLPQGRGDWYASSGYATRAASR
ncbi:DUF899 family protein [Micromonospora sp. NPDC003776]